MSKRHQSSRRKTYGRRQHEVRERHDRGQHAGGLRIRARRLGSRRARPIRSGSSTRAVHASRFAARRLTMAVYEGARPRTIALPAAPSDRRASRRLDAASRPDRAPGRPADQPPRPRRSAAIVVAFLLAFFSLAQHVRVSATGYDIGRLELERQRLDDTRQDLSSDLNRLGREPAIRKQAIDARPRPAGRADRPPGRCRSTDRCWAVRIRVVASSSCWSSSWSARSRSSRGWATGRSSTASVLLIAGDRPDHRHASTRPPSAATSTTGPARSSWRRRSQRDRLVASPDQLTPRDATLDRRRRSLRSSGSTPTRRSRSATGSTRSRKPYVILRHGLERLTWPTGSERASRDRTVSG